MGNMLCFVKPISTRKNDESYDLLFSVTVAICVKSSFHFFFVRHNEYIYGYITVFKSIIRYEKNIALNAGVVRFYILMNIILYFFFWFFK